MKRFDPEAYNTNFESINATIPNVSEKALEEIEKLVRAGEKIKAIALYREHTGQGLAEAKAAIEKFAVEKGISIESPQESPQNTTKPAEYWIRIFGIFGVTPYTFIVGIFALCFVNKAKEENGGTLSNKAKRYLMMGVIGFCAWFLLFVILFAFIA